MNWIIGTMRPYLGRDVLEVGIGHGSYYEILGKLGRYSGVDIDPENVANSKSRYPGGDFAIADICSEEFRARFAPGSVDTVVCCNVIEHIEDDSRAVANMANALSRGGHLLLLVPALQQLYGDLDRLAGHHRRYNKALMLKACAGAPIEILELRYFNPIGGLAWWINTFAKHETLDDSAVNTQIRIFDKYVLPISRMVDPLTRSFFGQSLICVARRS
ncbi:class I SAM-dependent methyltransferase [Bradyrhizobium guangdongense]|uniref:class I SAM-dependent methyltransferase n=1 Tax=Bradyrhizobium guangdongense TaxID=1325090 RepID=UPI001642AF46|nr:class I SAM-dependent methyltransferase [Bradyrhizobium guangdongense]